ncbi:MAG: ATP-grasp domain-containing protein [Taibaiella sp.]|nr:ATP-grasp domain-containing protein [Taibaiella sp.]
MYKILIVSYANWDSLMELPAVFKQAGCTTDIYCAKDSWILQSSFYDKWIEASSNEATFLSGLYDIVGKHGNEYDWIIPGDDIILRLLNDTITDEKLFYKLLPLTKIENRELLGSKAGFSNLCDKYDIKTPRFLIYDAGQSPESIAKYMGFPFMMKTDRSEAGTGVFKCDNLHDLIDNLKNVENKHNVVFQQFIEGYDINMEVLYKEGELIVYSYAKLLKILGKFGLSTQRLFSQNTEIIPELRKIGRSIGLNGFASIAFMYNELDKKHYLIEIDVRPNSWIYYGRFTGNDFSEGIKKISKGDLTLVNFDSNKYPSEVKVSLYKKDMMRVIVTKDVKGFLYWMLNKEDCRKYIPTYDKKLLKSTNKYLGWFFKELVKEKVQKLAGSKK